MTRREMRAAYAVYKASHNMKGDLYLLTVDFVEAADKILMPAPQGQ